jgi:hypothetical protein
MSARLPRTRLRMEVADLLVGETSWIRQHHLHVQADGRVYVRKDADMVPWYGRGDWPNHNTYGDYLVEREEDGFALHVFKDDTFGTGRDLEGSEAERYFAFSRIELHVPEHKPCKTCGGRGWVVEEKS